MPSTLLDLYTIEANSRLALEAGEASDVTQARALRQRVRSAVCTHARDILSDTTPLPSTDPDRTIALEAIAWSQRSIQSPESAADIMLRLALMGAASGTPAQILNISDTGLQAVIAPLVPLLAKGLLLVR